MAIDRLFVTELSLYTNEIPVILFFIFSSSKLTLIAVRQMVSSRRYYYVSKKITQNIYKLDVLGYNIIGCVAPFF